MEQVAPIGPRTGSVDPASSVEWDAVEAAIDCGLETAIENATESRRRLFTALGRSTAALIVERHPL